jgi:hypothetical protein
MSESKNLSEIKLNKPKETTLWRNNCGLAVYKKGDRTWSVRYGLCDGSSDLIGGTRIKITPEMVNREILVFTAVEVKVEKGKKRDDQIHFINFIKQSGGIATFATSSKDVEKCVDEFKKLGNIPNNKGAK